ncbi:GNAT family N-acetyltransferase [Nocardia sp. NEAU-G5]|uniref:GNAT family N-acetyltransferase n=1 Tax=Nocardia albiluteola TaxID=2842303 RepID=A0ABS6B233_9NOCA|nr:GNAT family N-acetyltransferase [Nocardia albiluteola]MBU3063840.1 GNAT family N-acetyltransferase [Nocardia albiluteola]
MTAQVRIVPYTADHLAGVVALCAAQGWPSLPADTARAGAALRAPGAVTLVAVEAGGVVGFAHALSNGWWGCLSLLLVAESHRGAGIGRRLVAEVFRTGGITRLDLLTDDAGGFYRSLPHKTLDGFRVYPL